MFSNDGGKLHLYISIVYKLFLSVNFMVKRTKIIFCYSYWIKLTHKFHKTVSRLFRHDKIGKDSYNEFQRKNDRIPN